MPDILIRGMEMPRCCAECDFADFQDIDFEIFYYCNRTEKIIEEDEAHKIHPDCPIHELPSHGDLISRDAVLNKIDAYVCGSQDSEFIKNEIIKAMPVIVPAERRDANA